ncbi:MAG: TRAP transporter small permease [Alphaproteobacteria bacterium]|nr:TRAP transporter small permease [Alphaproteobacteria bacterium]
MWRKFDKISDLMGTVAAWMFFAVGLFVTFEVVMRYVFTAPTIWVDEVSRIFQIWATFLAGAYLLRHREMILIDVFLKDPKTLVRRIVESFSIIVIGFFCIVTVKFGFDLWLKATLAGHTTDSFLAPPKWLTHASVWVGFGLMLIQCAVELIRIWVDGVPGAEHHEEL